jgi:hypothetical protein
MKQGISMTQLIKSLSHFLHRYHVLIFVLTVIGGLSLATFMINQAINTSSEAAPIETNESFDKETMEKIKALRTSDEPAPLTLPAGRVNPFI